MATVAHKAFFAQLHGLSGVITKPADRVLFLEPESGAVVTITDVDQPHLVVLGAVDVAMAQYVTDMAAGGYAQIACRKSRPCTYACSSIFSVVMATRQHQLN
jgi:hypothetical protein